MSEAPEDRREVSLGELSRLQRAGNINMADIQVEGICTIFRKDGSIKGQMRICTVEEAEAEEAAKVAALTPQPE